MNSIYSTTNTTSTESTEVAQPTKCLRDVGVGGPHSTEQTSWWEHTTFIIYSMLESEVLGIIFIIHSMLQSEVY
jgi:hypothetical protein